MGSHSTTTMWITTIIFMLSFTTKIYSSLLVSSNSTDSNEHDLGNVNKSLSERVFELEKIIDEMKKEIRFSRTKSYKTCEELRSSYNVSGVYAIDPEGSGFPVELYCDMNEGITEVGHKSEGEQDVDYC